MKIRDYTGRGPIWWLHGTTTEGCHWK